VKVGFTKKFEKQLAAITQPKELSQIRDAVKSIMDASRLDAIPSIKKLKGYTNAFRVRSGHYRIGLIAENNGSLTLAAIDKRKDFYKGFP